jgi:maleylacetate reductase
MSPVLRFGPGARAELAEVCAEVGVERPLLVTTHRGAAVAAELPVVGVYDGVLPHVPVETVEEAVRLATELAADGLVALGGGSAVDTAKAVAARLYDAEPQVTDRYKVIAIPTTYAGAEWTPYFGLLLAPGRKGGGRDDRVAPVAALYDPELTLDLPLTVTVGTTMNGLAHCAEAYYAPDADERAAACADAGATAIAYALPLVVAEPDSLYARCRLLEGAMQGAFALSFSGLCLAHAMAQGLGGRYGLPQGSMNAICLPAALRFNAEAVPDAVARFAVALGTDDAAAKCAELALLGGFARLRDEGVPEDGLRDVAAAISERPGAKANPRPATPDDVERLLREIW